jgi:hypothetical protein
MNVKTILVTGLVVVVVYFIISPYQNCMRDGGGRYQSERSVFCARFTAW